MILTFLNITLSIGTWLFRLLGVPTILPKLQAVLNNNSFMSFITSFRNWLSWIFYFVPKDLVSLLCAAAIALGVVRIFIAIFRLIIDMV